MGRASTESSLLVKSLASQYGRTERWARKERAKNSQLWQDFSAGIAVPTPAMRPIAQSDRVTVPHDASDAEKATAIKQSTWNQLQGLSLMLQAALADPHKQDSVQPLARAVRETRKAWEEASKHEQAMLRAESMLVPVDRVRDIRSHLTILSDLFQRLRVDIAGRIDPSMRPAFYRAFDASMPDWNKGILQLNDYIRTLLPSC